MVNRNSLILLLLGVLFAAPGLVAYFFYSHPQWLGTSRTNKGILLTPPVKFVKMGEQSKWRLILWNPEYCSSNCLKQLDKLARIRLALGRRFYEVEQWLLLDKAESPQAPLLNLLKNRDIKIRCLAKNESGQLSILKSEPQIFIENPSDFLVLAYALDTQSEDIYHDIKHLLSLDKTND
ncbi:Uncharacterised protein [Legionella lansingensis]|uniref:Transmembrane protein n=2 Tax=Legionella lansingensis TaxID=45067 RepID=A0A0W0VWZ6_9GAMM|nr:hypothetical protein [Legionella lansingensis]KTD24715.1 hypothetical protein Llan_0409 [Legionella lansingensis]SNV53524.1 Uncharacterised protein [Legionella lansingensis]